MLPRKCAINNSLVGRQLHNSYLITKCSTLRGPDQLKVGISNSFEGTSSCRQKLRQGRCYVTISNANANTNSNTNSGTSCLSSNKCIRMGLVQQSPFQNYYNLQNTRSYIFFEKGFRYYFNLFFTNKRKEKLNRRRKQIIIKLREGTPSRVSKIMDTLHSKSKRQRQKIAAAAASSPTRIKFHNWTINKQQNMNTLYSKRKSLAMVQYNDTKKFMKDLKTYKRFNKLYDRTKRRTKRGRDRIRGRIRTMPYPLSLSHYSRHAITIDEPFQKEWFSKDGYPLTSRDPLTGRFLNPWNSESTNGFKRLEEVWRWKKTRFTSNFLQRFTPTENESAVIYGCSDSKSHDHRFGLITQKSREELLKEAHTPVKDEVKLTWIGHATSLVRFSDKFTVLTDPVFSNKASPIQMFQDSEFLGVPRWQPPSLPIDELGEIDVCVISHDHYDHLDLQSIEELFEKDLVKFWAVPMGLKDWLVDNIGIQEDHIAELEWWQSVKFVKDRDPKADSNNPGPIRMQKIEKIVLEKNQKKFVKFLTNRNDHGDEMLLTCTPAQHWCSRTPFDRNTRLWCSWAFHSKLASGNQESKDIETKQNLLSFYFAGDTGYPKSFPLHRQVGDRLGPFDLSALPIGAYKPRFFMHDSHCDPQEALQMHQDLRSKLSVAIHWGTFPLANEPFEEPPSLLKKAVSECIRKIHGEGQMDVYNTEFVAIPHGESIQSKKS